MTQNTRLRQQLDARNLEWCFCFQQNFTNPRGAAPCLWRPTVITIMKRYEPPAVARKQEWCTQLRLGIHKDIVHRVSERVVERALSTMEGLPVDMIDARGHSAAIAGAISAMAIASTTSTALARPSSWKPFFIHAPQNQVLFAPLIARISFWASNAARS